MFKFLLSLLSPPRFEKPKAIEKGDDVGAKFKNEEGGIPPKLGAGAYNSITPDLDTHTETDMEKDIITALVFIQEDTNSLVIHFNGFDDEKAANKFVTKLMKKSGVKYKSFNNFFDLPTIH